VPSPRPILALLGLLLAAPFLLGAGEGGGKSPSDKLVTTVKKGDLPIEVELSGVFVADDKDEIRVEPKAYKGELIITDLVKEGQAVKEGDLLIEFEKNNIDESLDDSDDDLDEKKIELEKAQAELKAWEIEQARGKTRRQADLEKAQRELAKAQEEATLELESKKKGVTDARRRVKDAEVDFEQLVQLYEERELHSSTENILIERQRQQLTDTRKGAEKQEREFELWKKYDQGVSIKEKDLDVGDKQAEIEKADIKAAAEKKEQEAKVTKAQRAVNKAQEKVDELRQDTESLRVVSPRDGIVFYGTLSSDSPSDIIFVGMGSGNDEMKIGGRVRTHQVLMTVASMDNLSVEMKALESDIEHLKEGLPIIIRPTAFPALAIEGELSKVDQVASRTGFLSDVREFKIHGEYEKSFPQLRSGMNCRVTVRANSIPDCLQVPVLAVFSEGGKHYCLVKNGSGVDRREVKIGSTNGQMVEIEEGLREGESVTLYDPVTG
jgi:multidrug efflux pump subunit AcrA (membrane-fusion protein)